MVTKQSLRWKTALQNSYNSGYESIAYGDGKFVAIGTGGYASSSDGITWSHTVFPSTTYLYDFAIVFDGTKFVSNYGVTTDGINWTITGRYEFKKMVYANGIYIATTGRQGIYTSTDGINWNYITINTEMTHASGWNGIAYGNGKFVIIYEAYGYVSTSTDGETWTTPIKHEKMQVSALCYANGKFVTTYSNVYNGHYCLYNWISTDGVNWSSTIQLTPSSTSDINDIVYNNNKFVAIGGWADMMESNDGLYWTITEEGIDDFGSYIYNSITYGDNKFIAVGGHISSGGIIKYSTPKLKPYILTTKSGNTEKKYMLARYETGVGKKWQSTAFDTFLQTWNSITYGNGKYVAVGGSRTENGSGYVMYSTDGKTWSTPQEIGIYNWYAVAYGNNKFVVIGHPRFAVESKRPTYAMTSTNGVTWSTPVQILANSNIQDMTYGNSKFVAVSSSGYVYYSNDGTTWSSSSRLWYSSGKDASITFGNGTFVISCNGTHLTSSTDGINWSTPQQIGTDYFTWGSVAYGNGKFVVTDDSHYVTTSTDGQTWSTPVLMNTIYRGAGNNYITFGNGRFLATEWDDRENVTYAVTSTDGVTWSTPVKLPKTNVSDICYGTDKFVISGTYIQYELPTSVLYI